MKSVLVVGGGIAGLVAALLAARKGNRVHLVERSRECGGLLNSFRGTDDHDYDYGIHVPRETGITSLDELLYGDLCSDEWQRLPIIKAGAFFGGAYSDTSKFPDTNRLPKALYEQGLAEILRCPPGEKQGESARDYLVHRFGATYTRCVMEPASNKFYGIGLDGLAPTALLPFGLNRIIVSTPEVSRELKRSAHFDSRVAFHFSDEGQSGLAHYYPTKGGIGRWVKVLERMVETEGVTLQTGLQVESVSHDSDTIYAMTLSDGHRIEAEQFVWTVDPSILLRLTSQRAASFTPTFRTTHLYYFVVDRPFKADSYYYVCYDQGFRTFRTTLYSNLRSDPTERARPSCCVEVLCDTLEAEPEAADILQEQIGMGVIDEAAHWTLVGKKTIRRSFPVLSAEFVETVESLKTSLASSFDNVLLLGRASGGAFLVNDVLRQAYEEVNRRL